MDYLSIFYFLFASVLYTCTFMYMYVYYLSCGRVENWGRG